MRGPELTSASAGVLREDPSRGRLSEEGLRRFLERRPPLHFIGICGKGMGALAAALARQGWSVSGSDDATYPPMSGYLEANNLLVVPYTAEPAVIKGAMETLFVVGKRIDRGNPQLEAVLERNLPHTSLPQLLAALIKPDAVVAVVTGGVGKTTTTALLIWIVEQAGRAPDYFLGGMLNGLEHPARWGGASHVIIEGDEYPSSFDDSTPKFLHFRPTVFIVTNLLEDHPDLPQPLARSAADLVKTLPETAVLIACDSDAGEITVAGCRCRIEYIGPARPQTLQLEANSSSFQLDGHEYSIPLCGSMNIRNSAMAVLGALSFGVTPAEIARALRTFPGVMNRQEPQKIGQTTVVFDKATHPAALAGLIEAEKQRYPGRRILLLLQPRATGGRDWIYQRDLPAACATTDGVLLADPYEHRPAPGAPWSASPFDIERLAQEVEKRGTPLRRIHRPEHLADVFADIVRLEDDVLVVSLPEQAHALRRAIYKTLAH